MNLQEMNWPKTIHIWTLLFFLLGILSESALGQYYFGRNKVQYENFDFKVLKTKTFDVYFYPSETQGAEDAAQLLERWYTRFSIFFDHEMESRQPLVLYANQADFQQTNVIGGLISPGTGGVTEGIKNRIVLPLTGIYADNNHVLGHELVHAFQYDIVKSGEGSLGGMSRLPLWFVEGMAEYLTIGGEHSLTSMWMRDAVLHDDVPTIEEMTFNREYFPYRFGHALWAFIGGKWGDGVIPRIYRAVMEVNLDSTFKVILGDSVESLSKEWSMAMEQTYRPQLEGRDKPEEVAEGIFTGEGGLNLAPAISPDGQYVAFLSRRDLFTIDLFLANAHTGEVLEKLASSNSDAHFDALRFINSAGSWSPDSKQFAFSVFDEGDNAIAIVDIASNDIVKTIKMKEVDAITNLAWSPDGQSIALAATSGGMGDLYLYNLEREKTEQLTADRYADLQPAWAPDGKTLAFVTDRGELTDFEEFTFGSMKIGLYDLSTKNIELIAMSKDIKHVNPQFSPDGKDLYFIADPGGFSDIFRYSLENGEFYRITRVATGVTGITELAPAMTVARQSGRMMFSLFDHRDYHIYALDSEDTRGELVRDGPGLVTDSALPPVSQQNSGFVNEYLNQPGQGLAIGEEFSVTDYDPSLQLISIGQATVGATVDRFGTAIGGAVSFVFSDMLGDHLLGAAALINGGIKDIGGQVLYQNRMNRLNWGGSISHIPYLTGYTSVGLDTATIDGEPVLVRAQDLVQERVFSDNASLDLEYPLSTNRRFEFTGGFTRLSYQVDAQRFLTRNGAIIGQEDIDVQARSPLNLVQSSVAYVGDYSISGFTSPVTGKRYRFEAATTVGTLDYMTFLADYRNYFFTDPFTLALRLVHTGRYFGDAESDRLSPLFLGFETFVRGYDVRSFDFTDCTETVEGNGCPEFDRLLGSKIGLFNIELRVPLFGTEEFGLVYFPMLPTELALFIDGGVAWTADEAPSFEFARSSTERIPVFSTGITAKINLGGVLPLQFYYAYPFQRPGKGWEFGFFIAPGW